jgi:hypothetical protein
VQPLKEGKVSVTILQICRRCHSRRHHHGKGAQHLCKTSLRFSDFESATKACQPHSRLDLTRIKEYIDQRHIEMLLYAVYLTSLIDSTNTDFEECC